MFVIVIFRREMKSTNSKFHLITYQTRTSHGTNFTPFLHKLFIREIMYCPRE